MLYLRTLGELRLDGASAPLSSPRKGLTLLAYLARRESRAISRAELAELLWSDRDVAKARQSLRQALLELKRIVGSGLDTRSDRVCLTPGTVTLDVSVLERELASGHWQEAVSHWGGEFLADCDDIGGDDFRVWLESERERLRRGLRLALLRLIEEARRNGAWSQGANWAERWVEVLPFDEEGHRHLIELMHLAGHTVEALARHGAAVTKLRAAGFEPSTAFTQLGRVLERHAASTRPPQKPGSAALFTPDLVGRGPALAELLSAWGAVRRGSTATVLIEGEAGIGKTRLCEELLRQVIAEPTPSVIIRARGQEPLENTSLGLIREVLSTLVSAPGLAGTSPQSLAELAALAPTLRSRFANLPEASGTQPTLEAGLIEAVEVVAAESPMILCIDDLPRSDPASLKLLRSVISRVSGGVLFLLTARTGDDEPPSAYIELASESAARRLKLQLLGQSDIEALLGSMLELPPAERQRLARRLHAQGGGNPFYTIELTAALVDEDLLTPTESGSWRLAAVPEDEQIPLPATIREVVNRRLSRLPPEVRRVVDAAAVLGRTFDADVVPLLSGLGPAASRVALEELIGRRLIRPSPDSPGLYEFSHEIICRVAYDLLATKRRETLHRSAAKTWQGRARRSPAAKAAFDYHRARAGPGRSRRWTRGLSAVTLVMLVGAAATTILMPPAQRAGLITLLTRGTPPLRQDRVVVAPLTNHTGDTTLAGLAALAAEWIAQVLMRTTQFEVVDPTTSSLAGRIVSRIPAIFRNRNPAIALAQETGSGTVVSGDLFREGDSLRGLLRVVDVASGKVVRAMEPVSGSAAQPSRFVTNLGQQVAAAVATAVDTTSRGFATALGQPPSYDAYVEVRKAWESFFRDDMPEVFERLERATTLDSHYVTPLLMRAYVETRLQHWAAVDSLVQRLEPRQGDLTPAERAVLAGLQADLRGDLWARLRAARELMSLTPASVEGYTLTASSALFVNRPREALEVLSRVEPDRGLLLVAPFYWVNESPALHRLGDHRAELVSAERGIRRFPDRSWIHLNLLLALAALGDLSRLRREFPHVARDEPDPDLAARQKALWVWRELRAHGHEAAAREWLAALLKEPRPAAADISLDRGRVEGDIQYAARHWDLAGHLYSTLVSRHPENPALLGRLGATAAHRGDSVEARRLDRVLAGLNTPYLFGRHTYERARIAAASGDRARAVELLRTAWTQGRPLTFDDRGNEDVHTDDDFVLLRDFPPFQILVRTD